MSSNNPNSTTDLLRFLRGFASLAPAGKHASVGEVATHLGIERAEADPMIHTLRALGLIEPWPGPMRLGDTTRLQLSREGINAIRNDAIPS